MFSGLEYSHGGIIFLKVCLVNVSFSVIFVDAEVSISSIKVQVELRTKKLLLSFPSKY